MSRIDIKTLCLAFEKRISELEKNPPDKVPLGVMLNLIERNVEECIKEHFLSLIEKEMVEDIKTNFHDMYKEFIKVCVNNILTDEGLKEKLEDKFKRQILKGMIND